MCIRDSLYFFRRAHLAEGDRAFLTPDGTVVPAGGVELQHDGLGWIGGVDVALHAEFAVRWDVEFCAAREEVLGNTCGGALE